MRRHPGLVLLLLLAGVGAWWFFCFSPPRAGSSSSAPEASEAQSANGAPPQRAPSPLASAPPGANSALIQAPLAAGSQTQAPVAATNSAGLPPLPPELADLSQVTVLENMRTVFRQYAAMFGGNPVGTNPEITRALQGDNPKQINFLKADGNRVNGRGELVDIWGTPYFFHQLSATEMEIHSAGPDRTMWTADDLVIK